MVVIRLARGGSKNRPFYRVVVADSRFKRDGRFVEKIGFYDPLGDGSGRSLRINMERLCYWKGNGAQPSSTVARLCREYQRSSCGKEKSA
ncbi:MULTISPECIES: 30S ribosomal protein S16 [Candidatus Ichthyocystis]|uniref:Small ribosomal subunit protein bS16 n=1 Tax=Candidatus Ichthyocystis hellenicum TaxID=1561003 RepID=A0A0S4LZ95_9BURK|nr:MULTISPECIES: 30S ribosomal protein S16 [Ichthyocystis]CUT16889.1 30S ribosomal protein S16 [Candidatus Ichthyocystis hellenicum]